MRQFYERERGRENNREVAMGFKVKRQWGARENTMVFNGKRLILKGRSQWDKKKNSNRIKGKVAKGCK